MTYDCASVAVPRDWAAPQRRADVRRPADPGPLADPAEPDRLAAGQSRRSGRLGHRHRGLPLVRPGAGRAADRDHRPVRHRRLRPARRRPVRPGQVHLRTPTRTRSSASTPTRTAEADFDKAWWRSTSGSPTAAARSTATSCRCSPPSRRPATWTRSARRVGDAEADLPRLLVRHPARRHLRPAVPQATSGRWCWTARSTRSRAWSPAPRPRPRASSGRSPTSRPGARPRPPTARSRRTPAAAVTDAMAKAEASPGPRRPTAARPPPAGSSRPWSRRCTPRRAGSELARPIDDAADGDAERHLRRSPTSYAEREAERHLHQPGRRQPGGELRRQPRTRRRVGPDPPAAGRVAHEVPAVRRPARDRRCCRARPGPAPRDPYPAGPAVGAPPIVVVGTTGDPATPYENTAAAGRHAGHRARADLGGRGTHGVPEHARAS